jgi:tetratricopeptide (TPR) repeat protein
MKLNRKPIFNSSSLHPLWRSWRSYLSAAFLMAASSAIAIPPAEPETQPPQQVQPPSTPREFFNAGTEKLKTGKLREAEAFLQSALSAQDDRFQEPSLYNLGHVRFGLGIEDLKKGPSARQTTQLAQVYGQEADSAIQQADEALAGEDVKKMVAAYLRGRGSRRDLKAATKAVQQAMDAYGDALSKWQRASGDFKSANELNPLDANARQNAEVVDRSIAKLIDSIRQMQEAAAALGQKKQQLGDKMKKLRGRIPADQMPPGAAGEDEEDEDEPNGRKPDTKEAPGKQGEEQQLTLSPEQAAWMLEGFKLDSERRLPMGQKDTAEPKTRTGKTW